MIDTTDITDMTIADKLARTELIDMVPYQSARRLSPASKTKTDTNTNTKSQSAIWLNANEASGPGLYQLKGNCINRYPDFQPDNLLNAYSNYCQQPKSNILATRGADEGIELLIRTFCTAYQDNILICPPTYGMYAISAENHGAGIVKVPLISKTVTAGQSKKLTNILDIDELSKQASQTEQNNIKIVFLCSPGNPTGNLLPQEQIRKTIELFKDKAIVVVDEAYIEFSSGESQSCKTQSSKTVVNWLEEFDNLVILRTLSKAFALAGLRCGFTIANADIITMMSKVIAPYPIAAPVADIASNALSSNEILQMNIRVKESLLLREQLSLWLNDQSWCEKIYHSDANFVLFKTSQKELIFNGLKTQGILIRDQSKQLQLENCLRISIGSEHELNLLKQLITQITGQTSKQTADTTNAADTRQGK